MGTRRQAGGCVRAVIPVIRAYIDSIGGWITREFTREEVAALSRFARPRRQLFREFSAPRHHQHVKKGQPRCRWWLSQFTREAVALLQRWEAEGRLKITINRIDPAVDVEVSTFHESEAKAQWLGQRITKARTQGEAWACFEEVTWYTGFIIKDPFATKAKTEDESRPSADDEEPERQRGWGTVVYGDKLSRWGSGPCVHVETRFRDVQFVGGLGIKSLADVVAMIDNPARIARIVADHVRLVEVDWAKLAAQHARVHPPQNPSSTFHRERQSIMRRASRGMAQAALVKWGRVPGIERRAWAKMIDHPAWFAEAVAGDKCHHHATTRDIDVEMGINEEAINEQEATPKATTHTGGRGSPSQGRRCSGDEAARSESGVRGDVGGPSSPTTQHDVQKVLRGPRVAVERSRCVSDAASQTRTAHRGRVRLNRPRPRLCIAPPTGSPCPVGPSGPPGGHRGHPPTPPTPHASPTPAASGFEMRIIGKMRDCRSHVMAMRIGTTIAVAAAGFTSGCVQMPRQPDVVRDSERPKQVVPQSDPITGSNVIARVPSAQEVASADYGGPAPSRQQVQSQVAAVVKSKLKDPESGKVQIGDIRRGWLSVPDKPGTSAQLMYGWFVDVQINARNSFGGYTGFQTWLFMFRDGQVVFDLPPDDRVYLLGRGGAKIGYADEK